MNFANPIAFWILPFLILAYAAGVIWQFRSRRQLKQMMVEIDDPARVSPYFWNRLIRRKWLMIGLCLAVVALARPQWGQRTTVLDLNAQAVWIAIDLSNSMRVADVSPDRLSRAKLEAGDVVRQLKGAAVGVVVYAGSTYVLCPLTSDIDIVNQTISDLQIGDITKQGSSLDELVPLIQSHQSKNSGAATLVVFGDGEIREGGTESLIAQAKAAKLTILAVAIGSDAGGLIPMPDGNGHSSPLKDDKGTIVISKTNSAFFQKIAKESGGKFFQSTNQQLVSQAVSQTIEAQTASRKIHSKMTVRPDQYHWFLWPAIGFIILGLCWGKFR